MSLLHATPPASYGAAECGDGARAHAAKQLASPALIANASDPAFLASLQTYDEEYGSHAPFEGGVRVAHRAQRKRGVQW